MKNIYKTLNIHLTILSSPSSPSLFTLTKCIGIFAIFSTYLTRLCASDGSVAKLLHYERSCFQPGISIYSGTICAQSSILAGRLLLNIKGFSVPAWRVYYVANLIVSTSSRTSRWVSINPDSLLRSSACRIKFKSVHPNAKSF